MASKVSGRSQAKLSVIYNRQILKRASAILDRHEHPLQKEVMPSDHHVRAPVWRTKRLHATFIPNAGIWLLFSHYPGTFAHQYSISVLGITCTSF